MGSESVLDRDDTCWSNILVDYKEKMRCIHGTNQVRGLISKS